MSTLTVTNIKATGETASRSATSVAAAWLQHNVNYAVSGIGGSNATANPGPMYAQDTLPNVGYFKFFNKQNAGAVVDMHYVGLSVHGDLA